MTIQNICGRYVAIERDQHNGGSVGTGATPSEAVLNCMRSIEGKKEHEDPKRTVHLTAVCACG